MVVFGGELAGLADGGVDARVLHDGGRAVEAADVADLGDDLGSEGVAYARDREDERLDGLDAAADPGFDLGDLPLDEVDLRDEKLDLEGKGGCGHADAARRPGRALDLVGLLAPEFAAARPLERLRQRVDADAQALLGGGAPPQKRLRALPERVREYGVVLGEHLVEGDDDLPLEVGHALLELLVEPRELPQLDHRLVPQPARLEVPAAKGLGDEHAVDHVGLDARAPLESPHGVGADRVYDDDVVALVLKAAEQRQPVVAGRLHADEQAGLRVGEPLQVGDAPLEASGGVGERHRPGRVLAALVGRAYDVLAFRYVYSGVDHGPAFRTWQAPALQTGSQPPKRDTG